ncbi:Copper radical oxidase [Glomus cerebriforme]|uniref:Copper radical oxidase n=1 Tax=Glomus cerebriforme TaxID=658196 RepID=A0A397T734_9GLOM|nr:Copper radical oxidase [Glomus cerebriforme]
MKVTKFISIFALGIGLVTTSPLRPRQAPQASIGEWDIVGDSQVAAMHIVLASYKDIYIIDKVEANKIKQANGSPAISAVYDIETNQVTPLDLTTDTFCSAGSFFANGTLFHAGGAENGLGYNPGYQSARFITPTDPNPDWMEIPDGMVTSRWYPAMATLPNGNVLSAGGPPQPQPISFPFLVDAMPYNLYPFVHVMPNFENKQLLFVFANTQGILFDIETNTVISKLPVLPGGIRSYPLTANSILLPLRPSLNYKPTIMICGGNTVMEITSPAIASCGRIDPTDPNAQWEMDNFGGTGRVMPDAVLLPDATVLYVNGAGTGFAGYHSGPKDNPLYVSGNPTLTPFIYDPETKEWNTNLAPSTVPRLYHSVATLVSDGRVFVAGSNPQPNVELGTEFPTEYRVEMFTPPYLQTGLARPVINSVAGFTTLNTQRIDVSYQQTVEVQVTKGQTDSFITAAIIHHGFVTHSQSFSRKYVMLKVISAQYDPNNTNNLTLNLEMPPNPTILPPGPSYLYILDNGIPATYSVALTIGFPTT